MIQLIIGGSFRKRFPFPPDPKLYAVSIVTLIIATFLMMTTSIQSATLDSTSTLSMDIGLNRIIDSSSENSTARNSSSSHYDQIHSSSSHHRSKRGVLQLASMISCVSGCDPLSYKGYGCYCGYGGAGVPVDGIDRCCLIHDLCYTHSECSQFKQYFYPYNWNCLTPGYASCVAYGSDSCSYRLCECDRLLAHCLAAYHCPVYKVSCPTSRLSLIFGK